VRRVLLALLAVAVVVVAGFVAYGSVDQRLTLRGIDQHERTWRRERPSDYSYVVETLCLCAGPRTFTIVVADGEVVSVDPEPTEFAKAHTIEELFDVAREAIHDGADEVEVDYAADGHPTTVSIDQVKGAIDDEVAYRVRDLQRTPQAP
jgi:hypothetical protein